MSGKSSEDEGELGEENSFVFSRVKSRVSDVANFNSLPPPTYTHILKCLCHELYQTYKATILHLWFPFPRKAFLPSSTQLTPIGTISNPSTREPSLTASHPCASVPQRAEHPAWPPWLSASSPGKHRAGHPPHPPRTPQGPQLLAWVAQPFVDSVGGQRKK